MVLHLFNGSHSWPDYAALSGSFPRNTAVCRPEFAHGIILKIGRGVADIRHLDPIIEDIIIIWRNTNYITSTSFNFDRVTQNFRLRFVFGDQCQSGEFPELSEQSDHA